MGKVIKSDVYLKETLRDILENGYYDDNPRPKFKDGEPAYSRYVTQKVFEFNINEGQYPITTLRNGSLKMAFQEMKTIFIDQSNKDEDFKKNGVTWWSSWMNDNGNLGSAYSYNLEEEVTDKKLVPVKVKKPTNNVSNVNLNFEELSTSQTHSLANKIFKGKYCNFKVLDKVSYFRYRVQFLDCGLVKEFCRNSIDNAGLISPYSKVIGGLFYYGEYNRCLDESLLERLMDMWRNVADRITGNGINNIKYDESNITERWLSFSNFLEDVPHIPQYFLAKRDNFKGWSLDKDYFGASYYSKNTCIFLKRDDNLRYKDTQQIYKADGLYFDSSKELANHLKVTWKSVRYLLEEEKHNIERNRKQSTINLRHRFEIMSNNEYVYRTPLSKNQVVELLKNLQDDKFSRRHMLSFYNWSEQDNKQLVECAFQSMFTVTVKDGINYIHQTLTQRSSDFITAGMINCSQYVMLGMIICNHLKYKIGEDWRLGKFTWFVQNCHLYERHTEAAEELISKEPTGQQPKIEIICEPKDFFQHTWEDFKISGVEGITPLSKKLEIAI